MMRRFVDPLFEPYTVYNILVHGGSILVRCPQCNGPAEIRENTEMREGEEQCITRLQCQHCLYAAEPASSYTYRVAANCNCCERWFNEELTDQRQFTQKYVHFPCPYCQSDNVLQVNKRASGVWRMPRIVDGREPMFGQELYFKDSYRGNPVWALNRDHLNYLLDYIAADLRERPPYGYPRTASYRLPRYMKEAKNREGLIRLLTRMQNT